MHPEEFLCHLWTCQRCGFRSSWWKGCGRFPLCTWCEKNQRPADSDRSSKAEPFSSSTAVPVLHKYHCKVPSSENLTRSNIDQPIVRLVTPVPGV